MPDRVVHTIRKDVLPSRMHRYVRRYGGKVDTLPLPGFNLRVVSVDGRTVCEGPALVEDVIVTDPKGRLRTYTEDGKLVNPGRPDLDRKFHKRKFRGFLRSSKRG